MINKVFWVGAYLFFVAQAYAFSGGLAISSRVIASEIVKGRHGEMVEVRTYAGPGSGSSSGRPAGPWVMKSRQIENKIVAHCGSDRCKACVITFREFACFAAVRGGGFNARDGGGVLNSGNRSDGSSCSYKDTPNYRNSSLHRAALPDGFEARSARIFRQSGKFNRDQIGEFPPLTLGTRSIHIHSRRDVHNHETNQLPRYGIPIDATMADIEATSNSHGCPIVSQNCMAKLNAAAHNLPFEVREVSGDLNYNDFQ
jgi:hypothetical protein